MGRPDVSAETTPPLTPAIPLHPGAWLRQKPGVGAELVFSPSSVRAHPLSFQRWRKGVHAEALCTGRGQHGLAFPPSVGLALCIASTSIKTALDLKKKKKKRGSTALLDGAFSFHTEEKKINKHSNPFFIFIKTISQMTPMCV